MRKRNRKVKGHFLRGPIPLDWLQKAAMVSGHGSGFKVAIMIWYKYGFGDCKVTIPRNLYKKFGIERHALGRGLVRLEKSGLVKLEKVKGKPTKIEIVELERGEYGSS